MSAVLMLSRPIRTERLLLRAFSPEDLDAVLAYQSDPEVVRYLYWEARGPDEVRRVLEERATMDRLVEDGDRLQRAVVRAEDGVLVGEVVLILLSAVHRQGEIGFVFNPAHQGQGYAREAATAMLDLAFDAAGLHRVCGRTDGRNAASAGLMRRLGMRQEAHFRENELFKGEWGDELVFAVLADEWRALRGD